MDINEKTFRKIEKNLGASLMKMKNDNFVKLMSGYSLEDCNRTIAWMKVERGFYKNVLNEEYRKKNPNSIRYKEASEFIEIVNTKGKLLKSIIDQKLKEQ